MNVKPKRCCSAQGRLWISARTRTGLGLKIYCPLQQPRVFFDRRGWPPMRLPVLKAGARLVQ